MEEKKRKGRREERTKEVIRQFPLLRKENKSIQEIADIFGLSKKTVYEYLHEIAAFMGISRDDLLYQTHKQYYANKITERKSVEQEDIFEIEQNFSAMIKNVDEIIFKLDNMLQEDDEKEKERIR